MNKQQRPTSIRRLAERIIRRTVFRRTFPSGPIYVSGSSGLRYLFRSADRIDPLLCGFAAEFVKPGDVVWDIGANVGVFSFAAARAAGPGGSVVAVEADTWLVDLLRRSCAIQPPCNAAVQVITAAVAEKMGLREFLIASRSRASNALSGHGSTQIGVIAERHTVVTISLDWLAHRLPPPQVLKIDVEGAELEVLKGGLDVLGTAKPIVLCEVANEHSDEITALLRGLGYLLYDGALPKPRPQEQAARWNTIAIPG